MIRLKVEWDEEPDQFVAADGLVAILLELPVSVVQRTNLQQVQSYNKEIISDFLDLIAEINAKNTFFLLYRRWKSHFSKINV